MASEKWLIDANEAIANTYEEVYFTESEQAWIRNFIIRQPTMDAVEVVHGRWIKRTEVFGEIYCSECRTIEKTTDSNFKTPYCPWCGAKMDGERKDNG